MASCPDHSGMEEKIKAVEGKLSGKMTLIVWLLGILISCILAFSCAMYSSVQTLNVAIAAFSVGQATQDAKIQALESAQSRLSDRVDNLEDKVK